jgi:hypothetical protein
VKFHQNAKNQNKSRQIRAAKLGFFGTFLKTKVYKVFGLGSPDLKHLLLEVTKQQQNYKKILYQIWLDHVSCGWLP